MIKRLLRPLWNFSLATRKRIKFNYKKKLKKTFIHSHHLDEWNIEKERILNTLRDILGDFTKQTFDMQAQTLLEEDMGSYIRSKISYYVHPAEQVFAWLLVPKGLKEPAPAVLALHQTTEDGKDEIVGLTHNTDMQIGEDLVHLGYVVFAPDALSAGERIFENEIAYESAPFYKAHPNWSMIGKAIWDNQKALDYLFRLDFVDKKNIFSLGHSEGAIDSLFLAAFDQRIAGIAMNCGLTSFYGDPNPYRWSRDSWFVAIPKLKKFFDKGICPFDFTQIVALIAPRPFLSFSASDDKIFEQYQGVWDIHQEALKIYQLYNQKDKLSIYVFKGEHSFPINNHLFIYTWLGQQVKINRSHFSQKQDQMFNIANA